MDEIVVSPTNELYDPRTKAEQQTAFDQALKIVTRNYVSELKECKIIPIPATLKKQNLSRYSRFYRLDRFVYGQKEDFLKKAITVLYTAHAMDAGIGVYITSDGTETQYYLGVITDGVGTADKGRAIKDAFCGSFPGSTLSGMKNEVLDEMMQTSLYGQEKSVSAISGIPSVRDSENFSIENFVQGIENMADALHGCRYSLVIQATPVATQELNSLRANYQAIDTELSPYEKTTFTYNNSDSIGISHTDSTNWQNSETRTSSTSHSETTSKTQSTTTGTNSSVAKNRGALVGLAAGAVATGAAVLLTGGLALPVAAGIFGGAATLGGTIGGATLGSKTTGTSASTTTGETSTTGDTYGDSNGKTYSNGGGSQDGKTSTYTNGQSKQFTLESKRIADTRKKIDENIKRLDECANYGTFECAAYVTADSYAVSQRVAALYSALMRGEKSAVQATQVNTWQGSDAQKLMSYIAHFAHPQFAYPLNEMTATVSPALLISGKELALEIGLPKKSFPGVTVIHHAEFGCNPPQAEKSCALGQLYRMGEVMQNTPVLLNRNSLTAHVFVTGSTGAGKSNTIYHMLDELTRDGSVKFMVIEPAKGEYKDVFGGRSDVQVYSTNPRKAKLLRINPFAFPVDEISVQEHLDRLVEIFNVCWPMYAAMPAILKDACERAYAAAGWDIAASINWKQENSFPCFADVLEQIKKVLEESAYSADNKSDYTGALVTRIRSLTTGIYGQVFTNDTEAALFGEKLFDENVIVDLSRVGSTETKSLIMGLLVMQMQEYRMASAKEANSALKHITVLEEAHNILKRTSTEQSAESANLAGKSVEMLSNAIAEMRTYGEGFIIADQAPGLLDMAAIRNTNTKIIMRLPDEEDRKLVGKAAGLNDDQIIELSKLPTGVAAVYQNDWIEPILCKIPRFENAQPLKYTPEARGRLSTTLSKYFTAISRQEKPDNLSGEEIDTIRRWSRTVSSSEDTIRLVERGLQGSLDKENVGVLCYNLLDGGMLCESVVCTDAVHLQDVIPTYLVKRFGFDETLAGVLCNLILMAAAHNYPEQRLEIEQKVELLKFGGEVQ